MRHHYEFYCNKQKKEKIVIISHAFEKYHLIKLGKDLALSRSLINLFKIFPEGVLSKNNGIEAHITFSSIFLNSLFSIIYSWKFPIKPSTISRKSKNKVSIIIFAIQSGLFSFSWENSLIQTKIECSLFYFS